MLANAAIAQQQPSQSSPPKGAEAKGSGQAAAKAATEQPKPHVLVTISKETTYVTEPLRKDGYVDYVAALNQRCKKGVTPENNAAVLFWQAMGPSEIKPEMRRRYFQMLDMPPLPEKGNYFVSSDKYFQQLKDAKDRRLPKPAGQARDPVWDEFNEAAKRAWSRQEFSALVAWLDANEKPLDLLVMATKRPFRYDPMLCGDVAEGWVVTILLDGAAQSRELGRALARRATLRLKEGKLNAAWDDLLACHRLARLEGQGPTLVEALIAIAIDGVACTGDQAVMQDTALNATQIAKMREDLARLPPMPRMVDKLDLGERFMFLDCVSTCAREGFDTISTLDGSRDSKSALESWIEAAARESLDWDLILRMGNSWYDRIVAVCRKPTRSERSTEFLKLEKDVKARKADANLTSFALALLVTSPRRAYSQRVGKMLIGLLLPSLRATFNAEDRGTIQFEVTRLGFALAAYRADHGSYPQQLSDLSPRYVARVPVDIFANDGPLHYKRQGAGYLLYSVGVNGRDDGGRGYNDRKPGESEDWDDLAVRVP